MKEFLFFPIKTLDQNITSVKSDTPSKVSRAKKFIRAFNRIAAVVTLSASLAFSGCATTNTASANRQQVAKVETVAAEEMEIEKPHLKCAPDDVICLAKASIYYGEQKKKLLQEAEQARKETDQARKEADALCGEMLKELIKMNDLCKKGDNENCKAYKECAPIYETQCGAKTTKAK